jgi:hypothetical protein
METFSLYLAPESDKWEEIECDEAIQNITINIHVCPHQQFGRFNIFKVCICQQDLCKIEKINKLTLNNSKLPNQPFNLRCC